MNDAADFSLEDLVETVAVELARLGLSQPGPDGRVAPLPDPRTVRYYGTLGLLDRPRIEGRSARYGARHLLQLLAVKALQARGLNLAEVQAQLFGRTEAELSALVEASARAAEAATAPAPAVLWRELAVEPGLRLQVADGFRPADPEALARRLTRALESLPSPPLPTKNETKKEERP